MVHVFVVGSKGIPARYGGFETFLENLTAGKRRTDIMYHVSCMNNDEKRFIHNGADCFNVRVPMPGAPGRIFHVSRVLSQVETWCRAHTGEKVIVYILGCRIGPLLIPHAAKLHQLGARIFCNPDGLEWKRGKWNALAKKFLRYCESCLVRYSDLAICDSQSIEKYIQETYGRRVKSTAFIAYGADVGPSRCSQEKLLSWYKKHNVTRGNYYLIIGRFVPENNFATMIREFMASTTKRDLVIISNVAHNKFYKQLSAQTGFEKDPRIKFVGTEYDMELVKKIRQEACGYLHGHEVGGTNPSLLEALASTKVNLLLDVVFNREVGGGAALYWNKERGNLARRIEQADALGTAAIERLNQDSTHRVMEAYSWERICAQYEDIWLNAK